MDSVKQLIKYINESSNIVFFGGAGTSTESGLKDFRSKDGLYNEKYDIPPEKILSHSFFMSNKNEFWRFYRDKLNSLNYHPNITHKVLKKLEDIGKVGTIITQNIDGFDIEAGSKNVIELHGSVKRNYCMKCHKSYNAESIFTGSEVPKCSCGGFIKPDVVLYEEALDQDAVNKAIRAIEKADLLIVGGTSLTVYPAASLIQFFRGEHLVLINKDETEKDYLADLVIHKKLSEVFSRIEKEVINK